MRLTKNTFTHALAKQEKLIGLWITLCNNFVAEVTAPTGYDWVLIDMEHSPNDYFSVLGQLQVYAATDTTAIVRVCLLYTSPSPRDLSTSRMPSSA